MRQHLPAASDGCVIEDLDTVQRIWQPSDPAGRLLLTEWKTVLTPRLRTAQERTFGMLDLALRTVYPTRYAGFYLIALDRTENPEEAGSIWINGHPTSLDGLKHCLLAQSTIAPYSFQLPKGYDSP